MSNSYFNIGTLFGIANVHVDPVAKALPETRLNLTLKGTFTHSEDSRQSALISTNNGDTARHFLGEDISPGAKIISIEPGIIILRRNGQDEVLKLPLLASQQASSAKASRSHKHRVLNTPERFTTKTPTTKPTANTQTTQQHRNNLKKRLEKLRINQRGN